MRRTKILLSGTRLNAAAAVLAGLFLSAVSFAPNVSATPYTLTPGNDIAALSTPGPVGGTVLDTTTENFSSATLNGTVICQVLSGDSSNPYGGLTFTYLLELNSTSPNAASRMTVGSYSGFTVDVGYHLTGSEVAPGDFSRSGGNGDTLRFNWSGGGLPQGDTGALIVVQTGADKFQLANGAVIDDSIANMNMMLAPLPDTTGTITLLAAGVGVLFLFWRRTQKTAK